jgi:hypothetical protein
MHRNLDMGKFDVMNIGTLSGDTARAVETFASFATAADLTTATAYFSSGATMNGDSVRFGNLRVSGDTMGFRTMTATVLNRSGFSTNGTIIADRATINNSVTVGKNLTLKSEYQRTISGFAGIVAHTLSTAYVYADDMYFNQNFGLTVSGELMMSSNPPIRIGSWYFPSQNPPKFKNLKLSNAQMPATPTAAEFDELIKTGWSEVGNQ